MTLFSIFNEHDIVKKNSMKNMENELTYQTLSALYTLGMLKCHFRTVVIQNQCAMQ